MTHRHFRSRLSIRFLSVFASAAAFWPTLSRAEEPLTQQPRQLTLSGKRAGEGYFSADGKRMVFQSERDAENPFYQMYVMDLESGDLRRVSPGHGKTTCGWLHPDGTRVLYASTQDDPKAREKQAAELESRRTGKQKRYAWDYDENYDLWMVNLDGSNPQNISKTLGYDAEGGMSPDGKSIVFASNRHAYQPNTSAADQTKREVHKQYFMEIYTMNTDGSNVRRLTEHAGYDGGPFFSSDGKQICWRRFNEEETLAEIYVMNADGSGQRAVTDMKAMSWAPFFHPSGEYVIFTTNIHGFDNFELYLAPLRGKGEPVRVTDSEGFDGLASFSPDGKQLTWTSNRTSDNTSQIFLAEWDHAAALKRLGLGLGEAAVATGIAVPNLGPDVSKLTAEVAAEDLKQHVTYLASDALGGRGTGTPGEQLATDYAARVFQTMGLEPAAPNGTYFHEFEFTAGVDLGPANMLEVNGVPGKISEDWIPLTFSTNGNVETTEVVFAGYGLSMPAEGKTPEYDSYVHLDVKDKWVMLFRYVPESFTAEQRVRASRSSSLRTKAMTARQKGARGIIVVSGPTSKVNQQLVPLSFDAAMAGSGLAAVSVMDDLAAKWLAASGKDLKAIQVELDKGEMMQGFPLTDLKIRAAVDVKQQKRYGRNVLAKLAGEAGPAVLVGAHIDHLGDGRGGESLATDKDARTIHHGADDNGSGVAGMLEIAQALASAKATGKFMPKRDVYFAAWSGEELGVLGSANYAKTLAKAAGDENGKLTAKFAANINMDMIGRFNKSLIVQGLGSSDWWKPTLERLNVAAGVPLTLQDDCFLPTDAATFYLRGVPIFNLFTGSHEDYHKPSDTADKLDYATAAKITKLAMLMTKELASVEPLKLPVYKEAQRPKEQQRSGFRVFLGTIPDYAQGDIEGVKLSGVSAGGPAAKAGVKAGDIIVKLAGKELKNIYEYTDVMGVLKPGEKTQITVKRGTEVITLDVTPGSRD